MGEENLSAIILRMFTNAWYRQTQLTSALKSQLHYSYTDVKFSAQHGKKKKKLHKWWLPLFFLPVGEKEMIERLHDHHAAKIQLSHQQTPQWHAQTNNSLATHMVIVKSLFTQWGRTVPLHLPLRLLAKRGTPRTGRNLATVCQCTGC